MTGRAKQPFKVHEMIFEAARLGLSATVALAFLTACTAPAHDCTSMVGNSKKACEHDSKNTRSPDNSNNPDQAD
jgi:hypothetical protein